MSNLALSYWHLQKLEEAEDMNLHVLARRRLVLGSKHPDTLTSMANLALVYESQKKFDEAIKLESEVLEMSRSSSSLGKAHPDTLSSIDNLANTYYKVGQFEEAVNLWSEALAIRKEVLGQLHPDTTENVSRLLLTYKELGKEHEIMELVHWLRSLES
jgi:tetratricopeptide (TPR) repeat protein